MSEQRIDVNTLLQQLSALEEYIAALQTSIERINASLQVLYAGEKALEELRNGDVEALVDLDGGGVVYGFARINGGEKSKVLIHAGLDVFVEVPIDKALEIIRQRQAETAKTLDAYRRELMNALGAYQQLRAMLEQAIRPAARQQG
ncbi:prefoldin, alpha subunit [Pyrolobus fumarii 1A]|uniref:Prefoldin subunit alpha n=1 Tax=Pyrolobus fumarii (strain DSM 11204 / 1A) TaxID=694429 RepID=G0EEN0_PYRF1|nr:prefoldin subunit alpha [Pyrolobus fumarii]AEM38852.1 prefoldin, alpha subunit [Pyrolobus fumarii 1A]